jgi:hypothetical protein
MHDTGVGGPPSRVGEISIVSGPPCVFLLPRARVCVLRKIGKTYRKGNLIKKGEAVGLKEHTPPDH